MPGSINQLQRISFLLTLLFFAGKFTYSQDMQAITSSKFAGVNGLTLNPSLPVLSPLYLDINIASANAFIQNNYIYIFSKEDKLNRLIDGSNGNLSSTDNFYSDYYTPGLKHGQVDVRVTGPSMSLIAGKHAFSIFSGVRSVTSFKDIPHTLAKFFYEGLYFPAQYDMTFNYPDEITFGSLNWAEMGLNYSGIVYEKYDHTISAGFSIKKLSGYAGTYVTMNNLSYRVPNYDSLIVYNVDLEAGLSAPVDYNGNSFNSSLFRGKGTGFDIGVTWEKKLPNGRPNSHFSKLCAQSYTPYLMRVGIALTDIGTVRFTENSIKLKVENGSLFWPGISQLEFNNINYITGELSNRFFGNPNSLREGNEFRMSTPMMLNIHTDLSITGMILNQTSSSLSYNLNNRRGFARNGEWFCSSVLMIPLKTNYATVAKSSVVSVATRYETRHFQAGINASFWNFSNLLIGAHIRIGYFFIGSDDLVSFMKVRDYTGTSVYAGLKFNLAKGTCRTNTFKCPDAF